MSLQPTARVWRYMSFANFVSLLQKKQLWLSCVELFDDKWEVMLDGQQLNTLINKRPTSVSVEVVREDVAKAIAASTACCDGAQAANKHAISIKMMVFDIFYSLLGCIINSFSLLLFVVGHP